MFLQEISVQVQERSAIMFGQYKRIRGLYEGVLTGKGLTYGGSLASTEATGYGLYTYKRDYGKMQRNETLAGKTVVFQVQVTLLSTLSRKLQQLGAKLLHVLILQDGYMIRKESTLQSLKNQRS